MFENFGQQLEKLLPYFQGNIRKAVLVFLTVTSIFLVSSYFIGMGLANLWANLDLNPDKLKTENIVRINEGILQKDFTLGRTQFVPLANSETVAYTFLDNKKNSTIGYNPLVYKVQLFNTGGNLISEKNYTSYLLPGGGYYVIVPGLSDEVKEMRVVPTEQTQPVVYNPFKSKAGDSVKLEVRNGAVKNEDDTNLRISFILKNDSVLWIKEVKAVYIIRDDRDRVVGIGDYLISNIKPFEEKRIEFLYPKPRFRKATQLDVRPSVNFLDTTGVSFEQIE